MAVSTLDVRLVVNDCACSVGRASVKYVLYLNSVIEISLLAFVTNVYFTIISCIESLISPTNCVELPTCCMFDGTAILLGKAFCSPSADVANTCECVPLFIHWNAFSPPSEKFSPFKEK